MLWLCSNQYAFLKINRFEALVVNEQFGLIIFPILIKLDKFDHSVCLPQASKKSEFSLVYLHVRFLLRELFIFVLSNNVLSTNWWSLDSNQRPLVHLTVQSYAKTIAVLIFLFNMGKTRVDSYKILFLNGSYRWYFCG